MHKLINVYIYIDSGVENRYSDFTCLPFFLPTHAPHKTNKTNHKRLLLLSPLCRSSRESPEQIRSIDRRDNDSMTRKFAESFKTHFPCQHMHATTPTKKRVTRGLCACSSCCLSRTVTFGLRLAEGGAAAAGGGWVADAWKTVRA